ncbi:MAG: hypothetical protein QGH60_17665 [Phycisphaerae bacterium]|jgi:hypothetical protein|nr:hypothetical protein [Phycisphaerae bacterium]
MEVKLNSESDEMLHRGWTMLAGGVSLVMAVVVIALLTAGMPDGGGHLSALLVWSAVSLVLAAGIGICGICLMQQQIWAQRAMLILWLGVTASAILIGTAALVWTEWWRTTAVAALGGVGAPALVIGVFIVGALMAGILIAATRSRLRYASVVSLAVAAAIALAAVVNVISQRDFYRGSTESLGRYSISERTEKILADLQEPVGLTCVYTGTADGKKGSDFRPRVWELLEDLSIEARRLGKTIEISRITTPAERKSEDARLGTKQRETHGAPHEKFIRDFHAAAGRLAEQLKAEQHIWQGLGEKGYLSQWPIPAPLAVHMGNLAGGFDRVRIMLRSELDHESIRNYKAMVDPARTMLESTLNTLESYRTTLSALEKVHQGAVKNRKRALEAVALSVRSIGEMVAVLGKTSDPAPADPAAVIKAFIQAAVKASDSAYKAAMALQNLAGQDPVAATLLGNSSNWATKSGNKKIVLNWFFAQTSNDIRNKARVCQITAAKLKAKEVLNLRQQLATMQLESSLAQIATEKALGILVAPDAESRRVIQDASSEKLFQQLITDVKALVKQAGDLPELKATSLTKQLADDNIVIVEAGDKTEVVGFDKVWPLSMRTDSQGKPRRVFNGDSAIASRICSMTNEPFATVVFAYVQPLPTAEMIKKNQVFARATTNYKVLKTGLQDANFDVRDWELTKPLTEVFKTPTTMPVPDNVILIVLPSRKQAKIAGAKMVNLKHEIDKGTPAIFLTEPQIKSSGTTPHDREVTEYLAGKWGVSVMSDFVTIPAVRDSVDPTRFKFDKLRNRSMPQSNFSAHIIGKGLKGQRLLWRALLTCPIARIDPPPRPGLTVTNLLTVPADQTTTWATSRFFELQTQYRTSEGSFIRPDFTAKDNPDIKSPFDLAVTATREGDSAAGEEPNSIVVLGVGASLVDSYVGADVEVHAQNRTTDMTDPPAMNIGLVVNSVYWLGGLQGRIATGPAVSKPIDVEPQTRSLLMVACTIALPLLVLAAGGGVMLIRRRR